MQTAALLLGKVQGVFSKTFLLAGILPAIIVCFGASYLLDGAAKSRTMFEQLLPIEADGAEPTKTDAAAKTAGTGEPKVAATSPSPKDSLPRAAALMTLVLLAVAGAFSSLRSLLLQCYQSLPLPARVRAPFLRWQERRLDHAQTLVEECLNLVTCVHWPVPPAGTEPFYQPVTRQPLEKMSLVLAMSLSRDGLAAVKGACRLDRQGLSLSRFHLRRITTGLNALYRAASDQWESAEVQAQITAWKQCLDAAVDQGPANVIRRVCERVDRDYLRSKQYVDLFPKAIWLMPTALGNRLAALDDYAEDRYGLDTTTFVSRLWERLPDKYQQEILDAKLRIEAAVAMSFACYVVGGLALARLIIHTWHARGAANWSWDMDTLYAMGMSVAFGFAFYCVSLHGVAAYADRMQRAIDLNWIQFIKDLGLKVPPTFAEALSIIEQLALFFIAGSPPGTLALDVKEVAKKPKPADIEAGSLEFV